jgi:hypothetical protein
VLHGDLGDRGGVAHEVIRLLRKALVEGREVDSRIMRESTSRILAQAMKGMA